MNDVCAIFREEPLDRLSQNCAQFVACFASELGVERQHFDSESHLVDDALARRVRFRPKLKVGRRVKAALTVPVVDRFFFTKFSTDLLLHHVAVFQNASTINENVPVSVFVEVPCAGKVSDRSRSAKIFAVAKSLVVHSTIAVANRFSYAVVNQTGDSRFHGGSFRRAGHPVFAHTPIVKIAKAFSAFGVFASFNLTQSVLSFVDEASRSKTSICFESPKVHRAQAFGFDGGGAAVDSAAASARVTEPLPEGGRYKVRAATFARFMFKLSIEKTVHSFRLLTASNKPGSVKGQPQPVYLEGAA